MHRIELPCAMPCFIGAWALDDPGLCGGLIDFFERNQSRQKPGRVAGGIDLTVKNSMDLPLDPKDLAKPSHAIVAAYMKELHACYLDYLQQWPFLAGIDSDLDIGTFNIQKYYPGGHFARVHSERTNLYTAHRLLAWMTYLNDVEDGGQTHFLHYDLDVTPERGKTLIWPAEWTHAHSGKVVNSGTKYIITGWLHFPATSRGAQSGDDRQTIA